MALHWTGVLFSLGLLTLAYDAYLVYSRRRTRAYVLASLFLLASYAGFLYSFLADDFTLYEVAAYSSSTLSPEFKLSASWAGAGGSVMMWTAMLTVTALLHRNRVEKGGLGGARSLALAYDVMVLIAGAAAIASNAFTLISPPPPNGVGLNPLLKSFWMMFHPPSIFAFYTAAAAAAASLVLGVDTELGDRFLAPLAWVLGTVGNFLGGVWAYTVLGWGGYWIWDPVETASLIPWLSLTAYFHAKLIGHKFERFLQALTGFSVFFAAFVTRGGVLSPLHGFGVTPAGYLVLLPALGFAYAAYKGWSGAYESVSNALKARGLYALSLTAATLSLTAIFFVCTAALVAQAAYPIVAGGQQLEIGVWYYNSLCYPLTLAFLASIPACSTPWLFRSAKRYAQFVLTPTAAAGGALAAASFAGSVVYSPVSPPSVNALVSFAIPFASVAALAGAAGLARSLAAAKERSVAGRYLLHASMALALLAVFISGPAAASAAAFSHTVITEGGERVGSLTMRYLGLDVVGMSGRVIPQRYPFAGDVPEEYVAYAKVESSGRVARLRVAFAINPLLGGTGPIVLEPAVVDVGLDEVYIVVDASAAANDLLLAYSKGLYEEYKTLPEEAKILHYHILALLGRYAGYANVTEFMEFLDGWSESSMRIASELAVEWKRVPAIRLMWAALTLMIVAGVVQLAVRARPLLRREVEN